MISIDGESGIPAYVQIYEGLKEDIEAGVYRPGDKLPSARYLAADLGVSRNTVNQAFTKLVSEGFVTSRKRSGYFVDFATSFDATFGGADRERRRKPSFEDRTGARVDYDFFYGNFLGDLFPTEEVRKAIRDALYRPDGVNEYSSEFGIEPLREQMMIYLERSRGVRCSIDQIAIQSGTRDGFERLLHLFDARTTRAAVEQPGYWGDIQVLSNNGFEMVPLPVTSAEAFFSALDAGKPRLVFVTPSHQFPTGTTLDLAGRKRLIEWADRNDAFIVEDDYDSEYRYGSRPLPSLQSLDERGRVIYSSTTSKVFSPGMRVSCLVLPRRLLETYRTKMASYWCSVSWIVQRSLCLLLESGAYESQVRKMVKFYRESQAILVDALESAFGDRVSIGGKDAGLHLWLVVNDQRDNDELASLALHKGVRVYPPTGCWIDETKADRHALILGYSAMRHEDIRPGVERLAEAWLV